MQHSTPGAQRAKGIKGAAQVCYAAFAAPHCCMPCIENWSTTRAPPPRVCMLADEAMGGFLWKRASNTTETWCWKIWIDAFNTGPGVYLEVHTSIMHADWYLWQDPNGAKWMRSSDSTPDRDGRSRESRTAVLPILMRCMCECKQKEI